MLLLAIKALIVYTISSSVWRYLRRRFSPSVFENIPGPEPTSLLMGSLEQFLDKRGWKYHSDIAAKYGGAMKMKGFLGADILVVNDAKAMHNIFVKDQEIYEESPWFIFLNVVSFGEGLLSTLGAQHRKQRKMLNPVFSVAHMRDMVPIFYDVVHKMQTSVLHAVRNGPREVEMVSWMTRTALELIGQSGLGYSFDSLEEQEPTHPYAKAVKNYVHSAYSMRFIGPLLAPLLLKIGNRASKLRRFIVDITPWKALHELRDMVDVMDQTSKEIYEGKKRALAAGDEAVSAQIGQGKDIMSILMRANMQATRDDSLTENEVLGQMTSLIFAAMDTTSAALSRTLHLLAQNPSIQDRLRQEIDDAREQNGGDDLSYDTLVSLPYLDAICRETLRLYPPISVVYRIATQDIALPLSVPIKGLNGDYITEIPVPKNTLVNISLLAANRNPEIWGSDADEWKPERWTTPLPSSVIDAKIPGIYSHLMTFIGGGRGCIGFKFSQLEMKVVLSILIETFKFSPPQQEIEWFMNGTASPNIVGSDEVRARLPLLIEPVGG